MNIKTRLALKFTLLVAFILLFFSVLVYYFSFNSQRLKFRELLLENATNSAVLLINVEEVDSTLLQKIHGATLSLPAEEIVVTDSSFRVIYSYGEDILGKRDLKMLAGNQHPAYFKAGNKDGISNLHNAGGKSYFVFVAALDSARSANLKELRGILLWSVFISLWLSVYLSYIFARNAISPVADIIKSIKSISASELSRRLETGRGTDELEQLAMTFNNLLQSLESAFKSQEDFVSNASHELRTPLSVMKSEADYILSRKRNPEEDEKYIKRLSDDLSHLNQLTNSLLELANINNAFHLQKEMLRIDEIVYNSIKLVKGKYRDRKIIPRFSYSDDETDLILTGNGGLLEIAFRNILDNACKFSEEDVIVGLSFRPGILEIKISDTGIGIPVNEMDQLNNPFFRGSNVRFIGGYGIGMALVRKILDLHDARFNVASVLGEGTEVTVSFSRKGNKV